MRLSSLILFIGIYYFFAGCVVETGSELVHLDSKCNYSIICLSILNISNDLKTIIPKVLILQVCCQIIFSKGLFITLKHNFKKNLLCFVSYDRILLNLFVQSQFT